MFASPVLVELDALRVGTLKYRMPTEVRQQENSAAAVRPEVKPGHAQGDDP
jgi:hypothetical protein